MVFPAVGVEIGAGREFPAVVSPCDSPYLCTPCNVRDGPPVLADARNSLLFLARRRHIQDTLERPRLLPLFRLWKNPSPTHRCPQESVGG